MVTFILVDIQRLVTDFKQSVSQVYLFFIKLKPSPIFDLMIEIFCRTVEVTGIKYRLI